MAIVESGTLDQLQRLAVEIDGFPNGVDSFAGLLVSHQVFELFASSCS